MQPFKDYTLREDEIEAKEKVERLKKGNVKEQEGKGVAKTRILKRLRGELVSLVQKLQKRHERCAYSELLRYYCEIDV